MLYENKFWYIKTAQNRVIRCLLFKSNYDSLRNSYSYLEIFEARKLFILQCLKTFWFNWDLTRIRKLKTFTRLSRQTLLTDLTAHQNITTRHYIYLSSKIFNILPCEIREVKQSKLFFNSIYKWLKEKHDFSEFQM